MTQLKVRLTGDDAASVSGAKISELRQISNALRRTGDWLEVVDGIEDVTVLFDPLKMSPDKVCASLMRVDVNSENEEEIDEIITLPVVFGGKDGPDLSDVCKTLGMVTDQLIDALCRADLYVDMMGFTPGFAYIGGVPENLSVPRLAEPRKRVPAGSLGLANGKCGTYALDGPGGWPIIGRVQVDLFDARKDQPFLLEAGRKIRLVREGQE
ncbi:MAG: allophanate hydrolase [Ponticaulis sp.]|nr:allophanate hydrolase [Ponticaulis sp.]|tara:strand:+ start:5644 stop:6276 length:633 start_codon:yes stop_codon:yes gene_type:complete